MPMTPGNTNGSGRDDPRRSGTLVGVALLIVVPAAVGAAAALVAWIIKWAARQ